MNFQHLAYWQEKAKNLAIETRLFINGEYCAAADNTTFETIDPAAQQTLAQVARGKKADVERAVKAARQAFDNGDWSQASPAQRKAILTRFADLMEAHREELALLETLDTGKPIRHSLRDDIPGAARAIRWYAEALDKVYGEVAPTGSNELAMIVREPIGVIAAVVPWNFPLLMAAWKLAPALAAGNCVVLKPAEQTPLSITLLLELIYVVEAQAPKHLQLNRFLPATPVRMLLDKNGNNLAAQVEFESFNRQLSAVNRHTGSKLVNAVQQDVHAILQQGEAQIAKAAQGLIDAARNEADEKLTAELSRLEALKAVNPNIRDDELAAIESNRQQVMDALAQAGWRLDALRLIVVTHQ